MRASVVINTYNRGSSLRNTLDALRYQTSTAFEVVVVNGPSTDNSDDVLEDFADDVRVYRCPDAHLSKSRNIGIAHAAGDIVAFIDDDAIPEPTWVAELLAAYDADSVGGAGGLVYDHTGASYQYEYSACSRVAVPRFDLKPPFDVYNRPGADPFLYLQGTNCSFRRSVLVEIGGFNEEIEYYLDETEVCMRTIDHGYELRSLASAAVHHKYLPSHIRNHKRVVLDPYSSVKNHCTFATRNGTRTRPISDVLAEVSHYVSAVKAGGRANRDAGRMTDTQLNHYLRRTEQAVSVGVRQGLAKPRPVRALPPSDPQDFLPFPILKPAGGRLKVCFVSREFPPYRGGIGRFTSDLARDYAAAGHEVHVVTASAGGHTVDMEDGVWVHRLPSVNPKGERFRHLALAHNYTHCANVYHEVSRIHSLCGGLDVVSAPIWLCEGVICSMDDRWPTVLTLHTTMKTIAAMGGTTADPAHVRDMIALEAATVQRSGYIYANSRASLSKARDEAGGSYAAADVVVPHGTSDVRNDYPRRRDNDGKIRLLFVGRIEARKGVDVLLEAAYKVLPEFPNAELILLGKHNPAGGESCMEAHARHMTAHPALEEQIQFIGEVGDDALMQAYADCDAFVLPSRYESFGLVLTEAMMFGKPVIACRAGGMVEIVEDGENGYLARPGDADSFADAMRKILASAETRAAFGGRSRTLYEERFSTGIMTVKTIAAHRAIAKSFRSAGKSADAGAVRDRLAKLIYEVSRGTKEIAQESAGELLSRRFRNAVDYPIEIAAVWHRSNEEFVHALYNLLLRRPCDSEGLRGQIRHLQSGGCRREIVEYIAFSEEARSRNLDTSWFGEFVPPLTPPQPPATAPLAVPRPRLHLRRVLKQIASKLGRIPVLGRGLRIVKASLLMPRTVKRIEARAAELAAVVHELNGRVSTDQRIALAHVRDSQRTIARELHDLTEQAASRDRQMQWALTQQAERLGDVLADRPAQRKAA